VTMRQDDKAARIDTETLKRDRPLADVIASYGIALRRESAGTYRALCPFHKERTPSFVPWTLGAPVKVGKNR
jgi:hypothetical protein